MMAKEEQRKEGQKRNIWLDGIMGVVTGAYSEETAQPFQRNGMLFRFKRHKAC